jgi:hypothetical protein
MIMSPTAVTSRREPPGPCVISAPASTCKLEKEWVPSTETRLLLMIISCPCSSTLVEVITAFVAITITAPDVALCINTARLHGRISAKVFFIKVVFQARVAYCLPIGQLAASAPVLLPVVVRGRVKFVMFA